MKPLNHKIWKLIFLLAIWAGLELGMSAQTIDCQHDNQTIQYYDNMRTLPGAVTDISGIEVTLKSGDKHQVVVRTFRLSERTEFYTEKQLKATPVNRTYFEKHKDGCWVVRYCANCREAFKLIKAES